MKTKTCVHCGKKFKRRRKRVLVCTEIAEPDCGRCLVKVVSHEGFARTLAYATIRIK